MRKSFYINITQLFLCKKTVFITVIFCIIFTFITCQTIGTVIQEPRVSLYWAEITGIGFTGVDILCIIQVDNPNALAVPFPEVDWELFINDSSFIGGVIQNNQSIRARGTTLVNVPVRLEFAGIFNSFGSLLGSKQAFYKIALDTVFSIPVIGRKVFHFEHGGELPLLQLPRFEMPSMRIDSMDFTRTEIIVTFNIENPNSFDLPPVKISYDYQVNRNSFIKSSMETVSPLAASSVTPVFVSFPVVYADLYRVVQSLGTSESTVFYLTADFGVPAFIGEPFNLEIQGSLPIPRF